MVSLLRFFWNATRGSRWRPWRSPYLRWRLETYTGKPADTVLGGDFFHLIRRDPKQFARFLIWVSKMQA